MIAILGGLGASVCFTISALCASSASRSIGADATLAGVMAFGLALVAPPLVLLGDAGQLTVSTVALLAIAGLSNVLGLRIEYAALRRGKVGVVVPIVSTEGLIAAAIAVVLGLHVSVRVGLLLLLVSVGVTLGAAHPDPPGPSGEHAGVRSAVLAMPVALLFGISLYTTGHVGREVSVLWVLIAARLFGCALFTAPLVVRGVPRVRRKELALVCIAGAAEVVGILSYTIGSRHQLAIAAVLASQFAALSAIGAYFIFDERLTRSQIVGLVIVAVGVGLLAAT